MIKNRFLSLLLAPVLAVSLSGCAHAEAPAQTSSPTMITVSENPSEQNPVPGPATLLYQGQASIRVVTAEGNVIYIDPYAGDGYDLAADLILVTHSHFDHNQISTVADRKPDCRIITWAEAIQDGEHQVFDLGYVTVEAVEAGFNSMHDVSECVGYILTFSNGASVYVTGDTSTTEQMPALAEKEIDYAFFCCDGVYNMGLDEAAQCAEMVKAKHNISYHVTASTRVFFDRERAEQFDVENRIILAENDALLLEPTRESKGANFTNAPDAQQNRDGKGQLCDGGADCPSRAYADLSTGTWYHEAVDCAIREGLLTGYGNGTFNPNGNLSRAMLAQILYNKAGRPSVNGGSNFMDVVPDSWYTDAVMWASAQGIVGGYGNGKFGPNDHITREQLAVMLWRYSKEPAATDKELYFSDADRASSWALEALWWAKENGILNGKGDEILDPGGLASRAETAQIFHNLFNK